MVFEGKLHTVFKRRFLNNMLHQHFLFGLQKMGECLTYVPLTSFVTLT